MKSDEERCDEVMQRLGRYFKEQSIKEIEILEKEIQNKNLKLPKHLDYKLWKITEKYMK